MRFACKRASGTTVAAVLGIALLATLPRAAFSQEVPPVSAERRAAILELFEAMDLEAQNAQALEAATSAPGMAGTPVAAAMESFLRKYMSWERMRPEYVRIYAETYTDAEIRELTAFYRSPLGRKVAAVTPTLARRSVELGGRIVAEHEEELQAAMTAALTGGP